MLFKYSDLINNSRVGVFLLDYYICDINLWIT